MMETLRLEWRVGAGGIVHSLETGETTYLDAILTWNGRDQVRDITVRGDGSISLGPEKRVPESERLSE